jgi:uncharacterized coiled-coil protein SlyX
MTNPVIYSWVRLSYLEKAIKEISTALIHYRSDDVMEMMRLGERLRALTEKMDASDPGDKMANQLDASDVTVERCHAPSCDDCDNPATHYVMLDMHATGTKRAVAELCEEHANLFAETLRKSLPPAEEA